MSINFDQEIERRGTDSLKYDFSVEMGKPADILPLWVADMDFRVSDKILDALHASVSHGIFGYTETKDDYFEAVRNWFERHFSWSPEKEWLVKSPGVVAAIVTAIRAFTKVGESVLIQQPVYYPFMNTVHNNKRKLVVNQLVYKNNRYTIDFDDFENKIVSEKVRLFLLCSPHNPVGRVWTEEELTKMGAICLKHDVIVVSDEIHCDFTYEGHTHTNFASIIDNFANNSVICTAPSKIFNLAGLQVSNIFIPNKKLRDAFKHTITANGCDLLNTLSLVACKAAYEHGDE